MAAFEIGKGIRKGIGIMNIRKTAAALCALAIAAGVGAPAFENVFTIDAAITASADNATSGKCGVNATWSLDSNGTLTISGTGDMEDYSDNHSPWTNDSRVKSVVIQSGITAIGSYAFQHCKYFTSLTIAPTVKYISYNAFDDCESLKTLIMPDSVTSVGSNAFRRCTSLTGIAFSENISSIEASTFSGCSSLETVVLPENITYIGSDAFRYCEKLKNITILADSMGFGISIPFLYCHDSLTIHCPADSSAENYAKKYEYNYDNNIKYGILYGDVNLDGKVDQADISRLQQYIAGWSVSIYKKATDVNLDNRADSSDLSRLQQSLAGWSVVLGQK